MTETTLCSPKVSIQMCTYNRAHTIVQAIDSVLNQTYTDWELIILDDCSTDTTEEILKPYLTDVRIRYIKNEQNLGITKNRNKALSLSKGIYVAVLDSDDYWIDSTKLEKQVSALDTDMSCALVGTYMHIVDQENTFIKKVTYPTSNTYIHKTLLLKNMFCHSSVMYRKDIVQTLGGYDESLAIWEDYDLWLRIGIQHTYINIPIYGVAYRIHTHQSNSDKKQIGKDTQRQIIERYKDTYPYYHLARILNSIRNLRS